MKYKRAWEYIETRLAEMVVECQVFKDRTQKQSLEEELEFLGAAREAIGKQIPLPPRTEDGTHTLRCPSCGSVLPDARPVQGCAVCLQAVDLSDYADA